MTIHFELFDSKFPTAKTILFRGLLRKRRDDEYGKSSRRIGCGHRVWHGLVISHSEFNALSGICRRRYLTASVSFQISTPSQSSLDHFNLCFSIAFETLL